MTSLAISLLLTACAEIDSTTAKVDGIHNGSANVAAKKNLQKSSQKKGKKVTLPSGKSPNGFHPAPYSKAALAKAKASHRRDKHGMPTYGDKKRHRIVRTTAYSHEENEVGAPWRKNAIGTYLKYGQVRSAAADWSVLPVGTKFKIKGLPHTYIVDDYGSALVGTNTVDIYHPNLRSMRRWGTQTAEITITQWGDWNRTLNILKGRKKYKHTRRMYYAAKKKVDSGQVVVR